MLTIWGRLSSINVRKAVWAAQEIGVPFERIDAGAEFGIVQTPDFQAKNPNGLIPLLEDGDVRLWESNVIVRYLCASYSPGLLYPQPLAERFDAERWMDWQQTTLNPAGRHAFLQWIRTPADKRDGALIAQSVAAMAPLLALLEAQLSSRPYLCGERLTMADIPVACEIHRWWGLPEQRPALPHLERWYQGILARPASRGVFDIALS